MLAKTESIDLKLFVPGTGEDGIEIFKFSLNDNNISRIIYLLRLFLLLQQ